MNSSGISRGLAATAIASLAITGLPFLASTASAATLALGSTTGVELVSPQPGSTVSTLNDGTDSTVRLTARAGSSVTSVSFEYSLNGTTWTPIGTATADDGAFAYEWAVPASLIGAAGLQVRAVAGAQTDAAAITASSTEASTNVTAGSALGVFQSPYAAPNDQQSVVVSGTASYAGSVGVTWLQGTDTFSAPTAVPAAPAPGSSVNAWKAVLDITGYAYGNGDQLLVRSGALAATDDTEAFSLYKQTITSVTAVAADPNVPSPGSSAVTVTVKDQRGNAIAGARVGVVGANATEFTNADGQATFTQAGGSSQAYYADATNSNGYEPVLGDVKSSDLTVGQYAAAPTSLVATSTDGAAFDVDEYAAGDITVQVKDQNGRNFDTTGQTLQYYWAITPFNGGPVQYVPAKDAQGGTVYSEQASETNGRFTVALPSGPSGTYELFGRLGADGLGNNAIAVSRLLSVKAGQADLSLKPKRAQAAIGGTATVVGTVALEDGTALAGRTVAVDYAGGNAGIVQATGNPAPTRTYSTGLAGTFTVEVKDPATPATPESGTVTADAGALGGTETADVDFLVSLAPAQIDVVGNFGSASTPGLTKSYTVTVSADSDPTQTGVQPQPLANTEVTLTLDHGFFTDGTPATTPVRGADAGNLKNLGTSIKATTDENGEVVVTTAIARDAGFDDDGLVDAKITATAGSATGSATGQWDSSDPLNGGDVKIAFAPAQFQESTALPQVRQDQEVAFDVKVTDQFGNVVGGESVDLSATGAGQTFLNTTNVTSDFADDADVYAYRSTGTGEVTVTGTWQADTSTYDASTPPVAVPGTETLTGSRSYTVYAFTIATAMATLDDDVDSQALVGQAVTETVRVLDSAGQPIEGVDVSFLRQGPGTEGTGDSNFTTRTNAKGEAYYTFIGTRAGTATVSAAISGPTGTRTLTDQVVVRDATTPPAEKTPIRVVLSGPDNGPYSDKLTVDTTAKAAGATIKIYKITSTGKKGPLVATSKVGVAGRTFILVKDTNGNSRSTYVASVLSSEDTKQGTSNRKAVR
ncbi:Ig-like domain-containing protein [Nocardioides sp. TRM66260-LWL]|uniref:beta strand repeat-containing protein n=1 Tax=Nocardioides sp. TRM66260-LWL TaxID=2874478 RepID=UPI001CC5421C|nr:Ig-like domain-containing protein [Nocardioides sp. TRM66260-LWL]MBZ5735097.1 Ig-like domain-containing protein [Nocardioides sp. TRM66260-LWL]